MRIAVLGTGSGRQDAGHAAGGDRARGADGLAQRGQRQGGRVGRRGRRRRRARAPSRDAAAWGEVVVNATGGLVSIDALTAAGADNLAGQGAARRLEPARLLRRLPAHRRAGRRPQSLGEHDPGGVPRRTRGEDAQHDERRRDGAPALAARPALGVRRRRRRRGQGRRRLGPAGGVRLDARRDRRRRRHRRGARPRALPAAVALAHGHLRHAVVQRRASSASRSGWPRPALGVQRPTVARARSAGRDEPARRRASGYSGTTQRRRRTERPVGRATTAQRCGRRKSTSGRPEHGSTPGAARSAAAGVAPTAHSSREGDGVAAAFIGGSSQAPAESGPPPTQHASPHDESDEVTVVTTTRRGRVALACRHVVRSPRGIG